jgi:hypothetical protein
VAGQQDQPGAVETASGDLAQRMERLPPGHPSSPYDEDGTRKPPVTRPADRELPLPDEPAADAEPADPGSPREEEPDQRFLATQDLTRHEATPPDAAGRDAAGHEIAEREVGPDEVPDDATHDGVASISPPTSPDASRSDSRSWWQVLPHLKEQWERHQERWPQEQRPPVDRSTDEPGSWRGDSDQYLNVEENMVAGHAMERIRTVEKKVTASLQEIKAEIPDCDLAGLENRLKGEERFKEKVFGELRAKPERTIAAISENMPDAVRYTFQFDRRSYVDGYWSTLRCMEQHGYEMEFSRNSWDSSQYKGINTRWRTPTGQIFEAQFHTPESFEAKQLTHQAYERIRSPAASDQERGELYDFQNEVSASIPVPGDALSIPDYHKKEG